MRSFVKRLTRRLEQNKSPKGLTDEEKQGNFINTCKLTGLSQKVTYYGNGLSDDFLITTLSIPKQSKAGR